MVKPLLCHCAHRGERSNGKLHTLTSEAMKGNMFYRGNAKTGGQAFKMFVNLPQGKHKEVLLPKKGVVFTECLTKSVVNEKGVQ